MSIEQRWELDIQKKSENLTTDEKNCIRDLNANLDDNKNYKKADRLQINEELQKSWSMLKKMLIENKIKFKAEKDVLYTQSGGITVLSVTNLDSWEAKFTQEQISNIKKMISTLKPWEKVVITWFTDSDELTTISDDKKNLIATHPDYTKEDVNRLANIDNNIVLWLYRAAKAAKDAGIDFDNISIAQKLSTTEWTNWSERWIDVSREFSWEYTLLLDQETIERVKTFFHIDRSELSSFLKVSQEELAKNPQKVFDAINKKQLVLKKWNNNRVLYGPENKDKISWRKEFWYVKVPKEYTTMIATDIEKSGNTVLERTKDWTIINNKNKNNTVSGKTLMPDNLRQTWLLFTDRAIKEIKDKISLSENQGKSYTVNAIIYTSPETSWQTKFSVYAMIMAKRQFLQKKFPSLKFENTIIKVDPNMNGKWTRTERKWTVTN